MSGMHPLLCLLYVALLQEKKSAEDPLLYNWDDTESHGGYYRYLEHTLSKRLDPLTELAIAVPDTSNPHIAQFKENFKSLSFQDEQLDSGSPKFSTFKP